MILEFAQTDFEDPEVDVQELVAVVEVIGELPAEPERSEERLSADTLVRLAKELKRGLKMLQAGRAWRPHGLQQLVEPMSNGKLIKSHVGNLRSRFLDAAVNAIVDNFERIHECERPGCSRLFVKLKRACYCSKYCQQRVMSERFFSEMTEIQRSEYTHGQYRKRVAKRKGRAVAGHVRRRSKVNEG
jgi:hypothetical protein